MLKIFKLNEYQMHHYGTEQLYYTYIQEWLINGKNAKYIYYENEDKASKKMLISIFLTHYTCCYDTKMKLHQWLLCLFSLTGTFI